MGMEGNPLQVSLAATDRQRRTKAEQLLRQETTSSLTNSPRRYTLGLQPWLVHLCSAVSRCNPGHAGLVVAAVSISFKPVIADRTSSGNCCSWSTQPQFMIPNVNAILFARHWRLKLENRLFSSSRSSSQKRICNFHLCDGQTLFWVELSCVHCYSASA